MAEFHLVKLHTISPWKVIVYSLPSIPPESHEVKVILYDIYYFSVTSLPPSISNFNTSKLITATDAANQTFDTLPSTLTHLTTGYGFNNQVSDLPSTLTHLTTGYSFNHQIFNLSPTLTSHLDIVSTSQFVTFNTYTPFNWMLFQQTS
jgi:hypothetical protein